MRLGTVRDVKETVLMSVNVGLDRLQVRGHLECRDWVLSVARVNKSDGRLARSQPVNDRVREAHRVRSKVEDEDKGARTGAR